MPFDYIIGKFAAKDMINETTGAIYVEAGDGQHWEYDKDGAMVGGTVKDLIEAVFYRYSCAGHRQRECWAIHP